MISTQTPSESNRKNEDQVLICATMHGYVAGIADHGENPYHYTQAEAWAFEHGREQGRLHRIKCEVQHTL